MPLFTCYSQAFFAATLLMLELRSLKGSKVHFLQNVTVVRTDATFLYFAKKRGTKGAKINNKAPSESSVFKNCKRNAVMSCPLLNFFFANGLRVLIGLMGTYLLHYKLRYLS